jgi:hypothetical protein
MTPAAPGTGSARACVSEGDGDAGWGRSVSLRVRLVSGRIDRWESASDEWTWFDYTHQVSSDELVVYLHTFRRVRERADRTHDALLWKHHTTKVAHRYPAGEWTKVSRVQDQRPPYRVERVPRVAVRRERSSRQR